MLAHARFYSYFIFVCLSFQTQMYSPLVADIPVKFDVPAIVKAKVKSEPLSGEKSEVEKTIRVVIPVSTEMNLRSQVKIDALRLDVFWNRKSFQVTDYAPRSQTYSEINGDVTIETNVEENAGGGLHLQGGYKSALSGDVSLDIGSRQSTRKKYTQRAKQDILVASGTSHRGTGAFFRFHQSSQESLEGGRELTIEFRVPANWRAGVLRVNCSLVGSRQVLGSWSEPYQNEQTFVVPVYLANDREARTAARQFLRAEQRLRLVWRSYQAESKETSFSPLLFLEMAAPSPGSKKLPPQWAHYLIQSGSDSYLEKYQSRLPESIASSAEKFVLARRQLLGLR